VIALDARRGAAEKSSEEQGGDREKDQAEGTDAGKEGGLFHRIKRMRFSQKGAKGSSSYPIPLRLHVDFGIGSGKRNRWLG